ncbi:protein of unknown function [Bradyrhizobium vignae]|uniref:CoA transferase n=1 Tax=Bradyrhizobium vignae TaxID=1549949 RepID=A0A2U3PVB3_9BRAD|nr:protein of unknown function [Bradyrhizobium vignae]
MSAAPLEGLRVVDFNRVLAGPHCTKALRDLGADVTKIEPPAGDLGRFGWALLRAAECRQEEPQYRSELCGSPRNCRKALPRCRCHR